MSKKDEVSYNSFAEVRRRVAALETTVNYYQSCLEDMRDKTNDPALKGFIAGVIEHGDKIKTGGVQQ